MYSLSPRASNGDCASGQAQLVCPHCRHPRSELLADLPRFPLDSLTKKSILCHTKEKCQVHSLETVPHNGAIGHNCGTVVSCGGPCRHKDGLFGQDRILAISWCVPDRWAMTLSDSSRVRTVGRYLLFLARIGEMGPSRFLCRTC